MPPQDHDTTSWLITGGCGFIGSALIASILSKDPSSQIRVLDNLSVGSRADLGQVCSFEEGRSESSGAQVELLVGDIRDFETCLQATQGVDVIVHLAANTGVGPSVQDPFGDCQANVLGILNMLEAARQNQADRFIFASSSAPVGEVEPPIHEELAPRPVSPYGASKLAGEGYCSAYYRTFGVKSAALRFGNVYGPGSIHKSSVVAKFIKQAVNGETCTIYGDGTQTRDFIFIEDLIQAILKVGLYGANGSDSASQNSQPKTAQSLSSSNPDDGPLPPASFLHTSPHAPWGEVFQIATNKEHTVNELAQMLASCLRAYGIDMDIAYGQPQPGDVMRNYSDTSKARQRLGWECRVDLQQGLESTVEFFVRDQRSEVRGQEERGEVGSRE